MAAAAAILLVVGTGLKVAGQLKEAQSAAAAEKFNATIAEMRAGSEAAAGAYETAKMRREKERLTGRQRALYAKAGVRLEGSPLEVMAQSAAEAEMDIAAQRYRTQIGVSQAQYEAAYRRQSAKQIKRTGYLQAGGTLLTAAGSYGVAKYGYGTTTKTD